jgi:hypothetical protein
MRLSLKKAHTRSYPVQRTGNPVFGQTATKAAAGSALDAISREVAIFGGVRESDYGRAA